jgi:hypothetical protein
MKPASFDLLLILILSALLAMLLLVILASAWSAMNHTRRVKERDRKTKAQLKRQLKKSSAESRSAKLLKPLAWLVKGCNGHRCQCNGLTVLQDE